MTIIRTFLWLAILAVTSTVYAADTAEMKEKLEAMMPFNVESITAVGNSGMFEVVIESGEIIYFSEDLSYGFEGNVIEMATGTNITEVKRKAQRKNLLASLDESEMIIYDPKKTDYTLTVFTDIDCGYCRKLHNQMAEYNALGIRIRYMAFPRTGIDSESFDKAEDVWCAEDRKQAMTDAKNGRQVNSKHCESPVAAQYKLGGKLGVNGTPALFLESGESLPGYVPPKRLRKILDEKVSAES
ncbi:MAG: thioredoxin fold domain-containing protein [Methylophaga sp.]|nr:thioredoxin fold domain-containing protein [Methylophaga sp.]